ncbi:MAG: molybdenum cofactor biosynthesis protein [Myxococcales bacterium]|nr:molybdenum cofactor biosynthesis protein [Myxococcales bacterium]
MDKPHELPHPLQRLGAAVLTVSDTRTMESDTSGALARARLLALGHEVWVHEIVRDERALISARVLALVDEARIDLVFLTGGTGMTRRDVTPDAITDLVMPSDRRVEGFGELFRSLSYAEIGSATIQTRADAWILRGKLVFVVPGSTGAVRLAFDRILDEQLDFEFRPCNFVALLPRIRGERD